MTKTTKKTTKKTKVTLAEGVYFVEAGTNHALTSQESESGLEYVYSGKIHKGEVSFTSVSGTTTALPFYDGEDHGITLEGNAQNLFKAENALVITAGEEGRTFCYTNKDSKLTFVGDARKSYTFYVRFYGDRWAVIYAD